MSTRAGYEQAKQYIVTSLRQGDTYWQLVSGDPRQLPMTIANYKNVGAGIASPYGDFRIYALAAAGNNAQVNNLFRKIDALWPSLRNMQPNATNTSHPSIAQATQARNIAYALYRLGAQIARIVG